MLTVKHIKMNGDEYLYPAFTVEFFPERSNPNRETGGSHDRLIAFTEPRYVVAEIMDGTVFVMNEHGKTVSRYDLGPSPVEHTPLTQEAREKGVSGDGSANHAQGPHGLSAYNAI